MTFLLKLCSGKDKGKEGYGLSEKVTLSLCEMPHTAKEQEHYRPCLIFFGLEEADSEEDKHSQFLEAELQ